ncbi:aspartyl/glutamyl-tRNA(Asn/Gln) amidotransferase, B subunit [Cryptococcus depauperatus CBS 7841]|uniref:Glutamyl-tRNA(Gln) amidotransferase subunit B, mitochondrial n=1 Tax=Cryptococcus depauperatus CBS 7841 TaxID=1295531 RepID=A0AAJ8JQ01_9TREE
MLRTTLRRVYPLSTLSLRAGGRSLTSVAEKVDDGWQTVVGLEIHAQIKCSRKLFSRALTSYGHEPNTHVNVHDAAFPGTLPVLNFDAIRLSVMTALALNCQINPRSTFDRKHYFYHDIPSSYQITQHYNPLARNGYLDILPSPKRLETWPDMRSPEEAGAFVKKLQSLLRRIGSADGDMEKGNLRVDANVSVHKTGLPWGTRCEIKNINSVRFLQAAIDSERRRHILHYSTKLDEPLLQETRGFNELTLSTYSLRSKEEAIDYRYMPDSNLPALLIDPDYLSSLQNALPEMPWQSVNRLTQEYGVTKRDAETLLGLDEYGAKGIIYFEQVVGENKKMSKKAINWIVHEFLGQLGKSNRRWSESIIPASLMRELVLAVEGRKITGTIGKSVVKYLVSLPVTAQSATTLASILSDLRLSPSLADTLDLTDLCARAISNNPKAVTDFKNGNEKVVMRLVGEVMKLSQGMADALKAKGVLLGILNK